MCSNGVVLEVGPSPLIVCRWEVEVIGSGIPI